MVSRIDLSASGSAVQLLPASWRDLGTVRVLEKLCFPLDAWPLLDMIGVLSMPGVERFKAHLNDELVGFVAGDVRRYQHTGWIATICVHPDYQGHGIGQQLLAHCEQAMGMPRVRLSVRSSNETAIAMYHNNGYSRVGRWPRYYKGGEDGIVMEKIFQ